MPINISRFSNNQKKVIDLKILVGRDPSRPYYFTLTALGDFQQTVATMSSFDP